MATQTPYELTCSLREHNEQLDQVRELLEAEPGNAEYLDLQTSLLEARQPPVRPRFTSHLLAQVIALTEDLLRSATEPSAAAPSGFGGGPALARTNWAPGEACHALFTDGQWHPAVVQSAASGGGFKVLFGHYAVPMALPASSLRAAPGGGDTAYVGVPAPKRLRAEPGVLGKEVPKRLEAEEGDDPATRERKRKLLKAFKSKQRLASAEAAQQEQAASWQAFRAGKASGKAKPVGFLTKVAKESMFAVPEGGTGGRVGVIGSGKALTPQVPKLRHG